MSVTAPVAEKQLKPISPLTKQGTAIVIYLIAIVFTMVKPAIEVTSLPAVILSAICMVIACVVTVVVWRDVSRWHLGLIAGVIDVLAFAALQYGTGGLDSVFAACAFAPLVGVSFDAGRRFPVFAATGASLAVVDGVFVFGVRASVLQPDAERIRQDVSLIVLGLLIVCLVMILGRQSKLQLAKSDQALAVSRQHSEDLKEVSRLKDEFVGLISHELRTPLSSILGYLELLRDDDDAPLAEEQLGYLDVAERNANRLLRLVGDLLFAAQVEAGKVQLDERLQPLGAILAGCVESGRPVATTAGITLVLDVEADCVASVDAVRLGQACDNLVSNAIKFTPRGGSVTVGLTGSETIATITVTDTGMGIAADELDQLFSRFFRATTATRNAVPGVGLGLVIARAIARAHGGDMGVTSEEGVGTCFSMTLPLLEPHWVPVPTVGARR
jgi:signal transduction histidine kinase